MTYDLTTQKIADYRRRRGCGFREAVEGIIQDRLADIEKLRQEKAYHIMMSLAWDAAHRTFGGTLADRFEWMSEWLQRRYFIPYYVGETKFTRIYDALFCGARWLELCWCKHLRTQEFMHNDTILEFDGTLAGTETRDIDEETEDFLETVPRPIREYCRLKIEGYTFEEMRDLLPASGLRMAKLKKWTEAFLTGEYDDAEAEADLSKKSTIAFEASKSGGYMSVADDVCPTLGTTTVPAILEV